MKVVLSKRLKPQTDFEHASPGDTLVLIGMDELYALVGAAMAVASGVQFLEYGTPEFTYWKERAIAYLKEFPT